MAYHVLLTKWLSYISYARNTTTGLDTHKKAGEFLLCLLTLETLDNQQLKSTLMIKRHHYPNQLLLVLPYRPVIRPFTLTYTLILKAKSGIRTEDERIPMRVSFLLEQSCYSLISDLLIQNKCPRNKYTVKTEFFINNKRVPDNILGTLKQV